MGPVRQREIVLGVKGEMADQEAANEERCFLARDVELLILARNVISLTHRPNLGYQTKILAQVHQLIQRRLDVIHLSGGCSLRCV